MTDGTSNRKSTIAVIIPKPQVNLVIYHDLLAPNSKWRDRVVAFGRPDAEQAGSEKQKPGKVAPRHYEWAELMQRAFGFDVLACPECGGRLKLIAMIEDPVVIAKILNHLGLSTELPRPIPARPPPEQLDLFDSYAE